VNMKKIAIWIRNKICSALGEIVLIAANLSVDTWVLLAVLVLLGVYCE